MNYLLFINEKISVDNVKNVFKQGDSVVFVSPGEQFQQLSDDQFCIKQDQYADYQHLVQALPILPDKIIYAWSWQKNNHLETQTETSVTTDVEAVFLLAKTLLQNTLPQQIVLAYLHHESASSISPMHRAFGAMARSLAQESLKLIAKQVTFIDESSSDLNHYLPAVLAELDDYLEDKQVRYYNGKRQKLVFKKNSINKRKAEALPVKESGIYLITGGISGLGLIVAKHLACLHSITLILLSRRPRDESVNRVLEELEFLGARVIYYSVDLADSQSVLSVVNDVNQKLGFINGIFHSAGIIRDSRVIDKTLEDFRAVLAPKVYGTLSLEQATEQQPLDFMVYFSSIASVLGNIGQTDYSYANGFMDAYSDYRNQLRQQGLRKGYSVSINWPLWESGGMQVDDQIKAFAQNVLGLPALETHHGLSMLSSAMNTQQSQLIAVHGDQDKIHKVFELDKPQIPVQLPPDTAVHNQQTITTKPITVTPDVVTSTDILKALQSDLISGVVEILEVNPKDADIDTDMNRFGFDSLTITTFSTRIAEELLIELTPVVFFEYQTIRELSEYMLDEYPQQLNDWYTTHYACDDESLSKNVDTLSLTVNDKHQIPIDYSANIESASIKSEPKEISLQPLPEQEAFAVIGMDGTLPQSGDIDTFWEKVLQGENLVTEIPVERWSWKDCWGEPFQEKNKTQVKWGGFISDIESFDAEFFGISRREAELMDPQHRLFLQTVWRCIENAGYGVSHLTDNEKVGLFCGSASIDYHDIIAEKDIDIDVFAITGGMFSVLVNRISYLLNFRGPSEPVETACSSSMVAIHRAMQSIRCGECDVAIAGGVHLMMTPNVHIGLDKGGFLSQQGRCATFDESADGYVRGEGCVALLIKPLSKAQADGDYIHAVIRGSAVNHGGRVNTLTTPNPNAQTEVVVEAWKQANVDPKTITCIEAHGTGTALGDPIEIKALKSAFEQLYQHYHQQDIVDKHCALGAVKANIGHLEFVAGVAGVVKMIKSMQHKTLPRQLHFNQLNPYISLDKTPFYIVDKQQDWQPVVDAEGQLVPLRGGVSSFGFGGVNCHIALEAYRNHIIPVITESQVVILSAKTQAALATMVTNLVSALNTDNDISLENLAYTLAAGREMFAERMLLLVNSLDDLKKYLPTCLVAPCSEVLYRSDEPSVKQSLAFLKNRQDILHLQQKLIETHDFHSMACYWVSGVDLPWHETSYVSGKQRLPLPAYPFMKTKYWITANEPADTLSNGVALNSELASLLQEGIIDEYQAEQLQTELNMNQGEN